MVLINLPLLIGEMSFFDSFRKTVDSALGDIVSSSLLSPLFPFPFSFPFPFFFFFFFFFLLFAVLSLYSKADGLLKEEGAQRPAGGAGNPTASSSSSPPPSTSSPNLSAANPNSPNKKQIDLKTASRDDLIGFLKDQNSQVTYHLLCSCSMLIRVVISFRL